MFLVYPPSASCSFDEILRVIDSLQTTDKHKVGTPVNWRPGDRAIVLPFLSDEEACRRVSEEFETKKPYVRYVDLGGTGS